MKTEAQFSKFLCSRLKLLNIPYQRIEATTGSGIPDLVVFFQGKSIWLELKSKTYTLRPEQAVFAKRAALSDVTTFVLVGVSEHGSEPCDMLTDMQLFKAAQCPPKKKSWKLDKDCKLASFDDFDVFAMLEVAAHHT